MHYWTLLLTAVIYTFSCYLAYHEEAKKYWWYIPLGVGLGLIASLIWFLVCKFVTDKNDLYLFNIFWDVVMAAAYYGVPILLFGVKLDRMSIVGVILILTGLIVLKCRG